MFVATLIADGILDQSLMSEVAYQFEQDCNAGKLSGMHWIDDGYACDLVFSPADHFRQKDSAELADSIRESATVIANGGMGVDLEVDIVVQPVDNREKKLLVADMDSTIIGQECIDELADYAGLKAEVAAITERAMQGELDFASALHERVALLKGLDEAVIERCLAERIWPNPGAATLVRTMRARGAETILVSGGFTAFVAPIARQIGFDRFEANVLGVEGGELTGVTEGSIVDSRAKQAVLVEARARLNLATAATMAVGDGANDRLMIAEAGLGIAFRAKPSLVEVADAELRHHGLDALLWVQGVSRRDWYRG